MRTFEIQIPDDKIEIVQVFLNELNIAYQECVIPNAETLLAMDELKKGNGHKFKNVEELFNSI